MAFVSVYIAHRDDWRNYLSAGFTFGFRTSSGDVVNNDGQVVEVLNGTQVIFRREFSGRLSNHVFDAAADATSNVFPNKGQRHVFNVIIRTYDKRGDPNFASSASAIGYSYWNPRVEANMFSTTGTGESTASVRVTGLDVPQNERLSYQNWAQNGYRQTPNGTANTTVTYTGMGHNTRKQLAFGMVAQNTTGPFLGNSGADRVLVWVYAAYSSLTKGSFTASREQEDPTKIDCTWTRWGNWGNITGWNSEIQILNSTTNEIIKTHPADATTAGNVVISEIPLDKPILVRMRVWGRYHDGSNKTEYSEAINLGYLNNTFIKVDGVWRRGIRTFIKVDGVWRGNNGLVRQKVNGVWK